MTTETSLATPFTDCVKVLRPEQRQLLLGLPHFITYLIAGADGEIDHWELVLALEAIDETEVISPDFESCRESYQAEIFPFLDRIHKAKKEKAKKSREEEKKKELEKFKHDAEAKTQNEKLEKAKRILKAEKQASTKKEDKAKSKGVKGKRKVTKKKIEKEQKVKTEKPQPKFKAPTKKRFQIIDVELGSKEWIEWRHLGIGSSDADKVLSGGAGPLQEIMKLDGETSTKHIKTDDVRVCNAMCEFAHDDCAGFKYKDGTCSFIKTIYGDPKVCCYPDLDSAMYLKDATYSPEWNDKCTNGVGKCDDVNYAFSEEEDKQEKCSQSSEFTGGKKCQWTDYGCQ